MTRFDPRHETLDLSILKDKVCVLSGGSSGIGAATVSQLLSVGAKVIFGDVSPPRDESILSSSPDIHYLKTDVRVYADNLALFQLALSKYGRVDHAIANAGLIERGGWFDAQAGIDGVQNEPSLDTLDVNLKGVLFFANIACAYLAHDNEDRKLDKSLTLLSSVAGWKESPVLWIYQPAKHGVLGLLRTLRPVSRTMFGVRVNALCPSMTLTAMTEGIKEGWVGAGLPTNTPESVAEVIVGLCAARPGTEPIWYDGPEGQGVRRRKCVGAIDWDTEMDKGVNGRALFIMGGEVYDTEEGLARTEDLWLGKEISKKLDDGQKALGQIPTWNPENR